MKPIFVLLSIALLLSSCDTASYKVNPRLQSQYPIPWDRINMCLVAASLSPIKDSVMEHEVRKWHIVNNINFPFQLERYYLINKKLVAELYLFTLIDTVAISSDSLNVLGNIVALKKEVSVTSQAYADSLRKNYNLFDIDTVNFEQIRQYKGAGYTTGNFGKVLIEQSSAKGYKALFMDHPLAFGKLNDVVEQYDRFCTFTKDSILFNDSAVVKWYNIIIEKLNR